MSMTDLSSMNLRFVRRKGTKTIVGGDGLTFYDEAYTYNVLQQAFYYGGDKPIMWRDVPCVDEPEPGEQT